MSRSYKKHPFSPICSSYGDKYCRKIYHKSDRRKTKKILEEATKQWSDILYEKCMDEVHNPNLDVCFSDFDWLNDWEETTDSLITKGKDYSLRYADRWSWASDGGAYYQSDYSDLRRKFDEKVFSGNIWEQYKNYCKKKANINHPELRVYLKKAAGKEKKFSWIQQKYIEEIEYETISFVVSYNKAHKFSNSLVPPGWSLEEYTCFCRKKTGYGWTGDSKWDDVLLGMVPTTLQNSEELVEWLRRNEEKMIKTLYRRRYGK